MAGAVGVALAGKFHRFAALTMLGIVGLTCAISYIWLSAPDLALTQLLVESVTLVLLLLGLRWLPKRQPDLPPTTPVRERIPALLRMEGRRLLDLVLALVAGGGVAAISYAMMTRTPPDGLARYFLEKAWPEGHGTNVVNVILVDFRAFDTLGEITVLSIAAIAVFSLLRRFRPAAESIRLPSEKIGPEDMAKGSPLRPPPHALYVPGVIMEWMFPVIMTLAFYLLLRGHYLPGGGFSAGVMASIALILLYMANGTRRVEARLRVHPLWWISAGLVLAVGTGAAVLFADSPFLTARQWTPPFLPVGTIPSVLLFDTGVYAVVVGVVALILLTLAHQSIRMPRLPKAADEPGGDA